MVAGAQGNLTFKEVVKVAIQRRDHRVFPFRQAGFLGDKENQGRGNVGNRV